MHQNLNLTYLEECRKPITQDERSCDPCLKNVGVKNYYLLQIKIILVILYWYIHLYWS